MKKKNGEMVIVNNPSEFPDFGEMPVQAVVENKAIAREDIPPLRKSATGKP